MATGELTGTSRWSPEAAAKGCFVALLAVGIATLLTLLVQSWFLYPFLFLFFGAVMVSAWFGGMVGGLISVLLSTVVVDYFFVPPIHSFSINATAEAYFVSFIVCTVIASLVSSSKKNSEAALKVARDELEMRVAERTAELQTSNVELLKTQSELANLSRSLSMGELTASIAHEVSQPLAAAVTHGEACLEWLSANPPNVQRAEQSVRKLIQDGTRAGAVLARVRALYRKEGPAKIWFDIREVIEELNLLFRDEAIRRGIAVHTEIAPDLPKIEADRVLLQQVILNLMLNAMEAMATTPEGQKHLTIRALGESATEIRVSVEDTGTGLDAKTSGEIFKPFFTTKPHGIGVGLSISQSILEAHGGRLWATPGPAGGATFQFTLPIRSENSDG